MQPRYNLPPGMGHPGKDVRLVRVLLVGSKANFM
jgi:hypothetical protein